ncbi:actin-like ATPase domain-containing protein, partial [Dothidotthia symphoricarpi CBS 119687]
LAIDCEEGAFDNAHRVLPRTRYDTQIDAENPRPDDRTFEKLFVGLYLGEMFTLVLVDLVDYGLIKGQSTVKLRKSYMIHTGFLSDIGDDESTQFEKSRNLFIYVLSHEPTNVENFHRVAELIAARAARLCACGVTAIRTQENISKANVAADGSVVNKLPKFREQWAKASGEILDWESKEAAGGPIKITNVESGSGAGCAIIAAMELER